MTERLPAVTSSVETYQARNDTPGQRASLGRDVRHALESTGLPVLMLDLYLKVRRFTSAATELFELSEADLGQPIQNIPSSLIYEQLAEDCGNVLRTLKRRQRDVPNLRTGVQFRVNALPHTGSAGAVDGVTLTFTDIGGIARLEGALLESQERLRLTARVAPSFLFTAAKDMGWDYVNPLFYELTGLADDDALDRGWLHAVHPDDLAQTEAAWNEAGASGTDFDQEFRLRTAAGAWRWFAGQASPKYDGHDAVVGWFGSCANIHEKHRAEDRQQHLLNELQHRVKNILAVVRSVLTRTLTTSCSLEEFGAHFSGRFSAISRTQGVLARTPDGLVDLEQLVSEELYAQGVAPSEQVSIEGPSVALSDRTAQTLGLALHELTTNALKFGALSVTNGAVSVRWHVLSHLDERRLVLEWAESGVEDMRTDPEHSGFGRELIEKGLPYELQARTRPEFRPGGVWCGIELPLKTPVADGFRIVAAP